MFEAYKPVASVVIPHVQGRARELSELIADWNASQERFLSANSILWGVADSNATLGQDFDAIRDLEDARLMANDLLRRTNPFLQNVCGLDPIDPYLK